MKIKNKFSKTVLIALCCVIMTTSCDKDFEDPSISSEILKKELKLGEVLIEMSYDMITSQDFETDFSKLSSLDLSNMNPRNEKQHIKMQLFESGQTSLTIEELDFKQKIKIKHKILPDNSPKIIKTEIIGNSAKFYDMNGKLISQAPMSLPNQHELAERIKKMGAKISSEDVNKTVAAIQGQQFIDDLDALINNTAKNGVRVLEQGKNHITIRMPKDNLDNETVLLVDKGINKIVGSRVYNRDNELLESTFFRYSKEDNQFLNAIRKEVKTELPSGKKINTIINTRFENYKFNLNI